MAFNTPVTAHNLKLDTADGGSRPGGQTPFNKAALGMGSTFMSAASTAYTPSSYFQRIGSPPFVHTPQGFVFSSTPKNASPAAREVWDVLEKKVLSPCSAQHLPVQQEGMVARALSFGDEEAEHTNEKYTQDLGAATAVNPNENLSPRLEKEENAVDAFELAKSLIKQDAEEARVMLEALLSPEGVINYLHREIEESKCLNQCRDVLLASIEILNSVKTQASEISNVSAEIENPTNKIRSDMIVQQSIRFIQTRYLNENLIADIKPNDEDHFDEDYFKDVLLQLKNQSPQKAEQVQQDYNNHKALIAQILTTVNNEIEADKILSEVMEQLQEKVSSLDQYLRSIVSSTPVKQSNNRSDFEAIHNGASLRCQLPNTEENLNALLAFQQLCNERGISTLTVEEITACFSSQKEENAAPSNSIMSPYDHLDSARDSAANNGQAFVEPTGENEASLSSGNNCFSKVALACNKTLFKTMGASIALGGCATAGYIFRSQIAACAVAVFALAMAHPLVAIGVGAAAVLGAALAVAGYKVYQNCRSYERLVSPTHAQAAFGTPMRNQLADKDQPQANTLHEAVAI